MSRGIQDAGRLKPKPGPASRCGPASEQGDFSLPPLPAVQRRRNPVPAPHRNRAGYDSRGRVSMTHLEDERGYTVMLTKPERDGAGSGEDRRLSMDTTAMEPGTTPTACPLPDTRQRTGGVTCNGHRPPRHTR